MAEDKDIVDTLLDQWKHERPDLDAELMAFCGRIRRLSVYLDRRINEALKPFGLAVWGFDILSTLRRHGKPYAMTPKHIMETVTLTSGGMTNRIDKLEELGFVERQPAPGDRRSLLVRLTPKGLKVVNKALEARLAEADDALKGLTKKERKQVGDLLRNAFLQMDISDLKRI